MRAGVGGAAGVLDDDGAEAQVGGLAGGSLHRGVGGHAGEDDGVDAAGAQQHLQLAGREAADALVGDDDVAVGGGELGHDLRLLAAVDEALGLHDDAEQGGVGDHVGVAGLPGHAGVDDGGAGGAGGIQDLAGLRGKSLAWADPNSTSGYLIPRSELKKAGIDTADGKYFSRTGFGGGHEQAVVAVLQKQYDAAATWASGIGDPAQGFTRGNLHEMVQKGLLTMSDLRILWTTVRSVGHDEPAVVEDDFHVRRLRAAGG